MVARIGCPQLQRGGQYNSSGKDKEEQRTICIVSVVYFNHSIASRVDKCKIRSGSAWLVQKSKADKSSFTGKGMKKHTHRAFP